MRAVGWGEKHGPSGRGSGQKKESGTLNVRPDKRH